MSRKGETRNMHLQIARIEAIWHRVIRLIDWVRRIVRT